MKIPCIASTIIVSACFFACFNDSSSSAAPVVNEDNDQKEVTQAEIDSIVAEHGFLSGIFTECDWAKDTTALVRFRLPSDGGTLTHTVLPSVDGGFEAACEKAKMEAAENETVSCDSVVAIRYTKENVSFDEARSLIKAECKPIE